MGRLCPRQRRGGACFCSPDTNFCEHYARRGTRPAKWPIICLGTSMLVNEHWRSVAVQFVSKPIICHGAET